MIKEFLPYEKVRNNSLKLAYKIYSDGFMPDVIYSLLRGGAYVANVISEYFKLVTEKQNLHPIYYAACVAHSYTNVQQKSEVRIDGWTYNPDFLRGGDKILLVDDVFDSGNTLNYITEILMNKGIPRSNIKVAVHDYKYFAYKDVQLPIQPDYYCRKFVIQSPDENSWIHYLSHELVGLTSEEVEKYYLKNDEELRQVFSVFSENFSKGANGKNK